MGVMSGDDAFEDISFEFDLGRHARNSPVKPGCVDVCAENYSAFQT